MSSEQVSVALASICDETHESLPHDRYVSSIPAYLRDTYTWAYLNPLSVSIFDRHWMVSLILLGNYVKLEQAMLDELSPGMRVLQPACVYGRFSQVIAAHVGEQGKLDVIDIAPIQVETCELKLLGYPQTSVTVADAAVGGDAHYDAVSCFFLLHEVPEKKKTEIIDHLLEQIRPGGRAVFVDYHRPHWAHPFRPLISFIFATLEPFARDLWQNEISHYATRADDFDWKKTTYFGGMYQKVVVTRK